jgi:hypothetical protein
MTKKQENRKVKRIVWPDLEDESAVRIRTGHFNRQITKFKREVPKFKSRSKYHKDEDTNERI